MEGISLAHILNPVGVSATHPLFAVQAITFESVLNAKRFSADKSIALLTAQYEEDKKVIPDGFAILPNLERSVLDIADFTPARKYPILADVFQRAYDHSEADYILFSNMDIGLQPYFYETVLKTIAETKADALLITRRRIGFQYTLSSDLPAIYADKGKPHPGYDMFVMHRSLIPKLVLDNICVGVSFSEVALLHNLVAMAQKVELIDRAHLTFHIGMDVMPPLLQNYFWHNRNCYERTILPQIKPLLRSQKFPYGNLSLPHRLWKWGLNPSYRTALMLEMESMRGMQKIRFLLNEIRWWFLQGG